jgi:hypothetical protein
LPCNNISSSCTSCMAAWLCSVAPEATTRG